LAALVENKNFLWLSKNLPRPIIWLKRVFLQIHRKKFAMNPAEMVWTQDKRQRRTETEVWFNLYNWNHII
jgi:hypothetical protein